MIIQNEYLHKKKLNPENLAMKNKYYIRENEVSFFFQFRFDLCNNICALMWENNMKYKKRIFIICLDRNVDERCFKEIKKEKNHGRTERIRFVDFDHQILNICTPGFRCDYDTDSVEIQWRPKRIMRHTVQIQCKNRQNLTRVECMLHFT